MPDKDDFTFFDEEQQDAPKSDLNALFAESETSADSPAEPEAEQGTVDEAPAPKEARPKRAGDGSSRTRLLLLVLLLVVLCGGGAYYFMGLGGTSPESAKQQAQAKKAEPVKKTVSLPPKPAATQPAQTKVAETKTAANQKTEANGAQKSVAVAVPPPTVSDKIAAPKVEADASKPPAAQQPVKAPAEGKSPAASETAETKSTSPVVKASVPAISIPVKTEAAGRYTLDAGSYLLDENVRRLERSLSQHGYQPILTQVKAKVSMTRLSLGSYPQAEAQKMLEFARTIEPGAFSMASADAYEVFAGTFVDMDNVRSMQQRFEKEGIKTELRQIEVVRTLNRICFGEFATRDQAQKEAVRMADAGIKVSVVKTK
ncbi:MAG: hypothetical protein C0614_05120 [Desulfuromonas sp.]|nr:MAG: hypothetical protein C0614_05120 [Desulfuromonas sp.]